MVKKVATPKRLFVAVLMAVCVMSIMLPARVNSQTVPMNFAAELERDLNRNPIFEHLRPVRFKIRREVVEHKTAVAVYAALLPADTLCGQPDEVKAAFLDQYIKHEGWGGPLVAAILPEGIFTPKDMAKFEEELSVRTEMAIDQRDSQIFHKFGTHIVYPTASLIIDAAGSDWNARENAEQKQLMNATGYVLHSASCDNAGFVRIRQIILAVSFRIIDPDNGDPLDYSSGRGQSLAQERLEEMRQDFIQHGSAHLTQERYGVEVAYDSVELAFKPGDTVDVEKYADYFVKRTDNIYHELAGTIAGVQYEL